MTRMGEDRTVFRVTTSIPEGKRPVDRGIGMWADNVSSDVLGLGETDEWMGMVL